MGLVFPQRRYWQLLGRLVCWLLRWTGGPERWLVWLLVWWLHCSDLVVRRRSALMFPQRWYLPLLLLVVPLRWYWPVLLLVVPQRWYWPVMLRLVAVVGGGGGVLLVLYAA